MLEATLERVHCAADHAAVGILYAVLHGDVGFGVLGCDAENAGEPHPEDCARAAAQEAGCHTNDVAGADGSGKGCGKSAELGDVALRVGVVLRYGQLDCRGDLPLDESRSNSHEEMGAQQKPD